MHSELSAFAERLAETLSALAYRDGSAADSDAGFRELALNLFELQYRLNLPYQALCNNRGILPQDIRDWRQIPAVTTSAFKAFDFSCLPEQEWSQYFESSGTTATRRSRVRHSEESLRLYDGSVLSWFNHHFSHSSNSSPTNQSQFHASFVSLTPNKTQAPHSSLVHMLDVVSEQQSFNPRMFLGELDEQDAWTVNLDSAQLVLKNCSDGSTPVVLVGTAFNFVHLLDGLDQAGLRLMLPGGSRVMETGGYKGRSREMARKQLHLELSRRLGLSPENIVTEYGMCELGSQAYALSAGLRENEQNLRFPPWARALIISPETGLEVNEGETGVVRIVDLANAFSVLAVETEDLAIRRSQGFELIGRAPRSEPRGCSLMSVAT